MHTKVGMGETLVVLFRELWIELRSARNPPDPKTPQLSPALPLSHEGARRTSEVAQWVKALAMLDR